MMDAVVEYRNDQPDEQENDRLDHLFCELRGLREDLRFLRMLSISQGRRIDDIMEQFEPKPSALAKIARYSVAAALAVAALLVTIIGPRIRSALILAFKLMEEHPRACRRGRKNYPAAEDGFALPVS